MAAGMFQKDPSHFTVAAERAEARRAKVKARIATFDAFPRPNVRLSDDEVAALRATPVRFVVDLLYVAHAARVLLEDALDGTPSNEVLALRQFALARPLSANPTDIARQLGVTKQTASALLARMKSDGLLVETGDPIDARAKKMWLNEGIGELIEDARLALEGIGKELLRGVSPDEGDTLAATLREVRERTFARPIARLPRARRRRRDS